MKKLVSLLLSFCLLFGCLAVASAETKTADVMGFGNTITVTAEVEDGKIVALDVDDSSQTYPVAREDSVEKVIAAILEQGNADGVDVHTGATITCTAIVDAVNTFLAGGEEAAAGEMTFKAGEYEASADGYNGVVNVKVTFSDTAITAIEIGDNMETAHVGTVAFDIMKADMLEANGSGVDGVSGATFTGNALRNAVNAAAEAAECSDLAAFKAAKVEHPAQAPIEKTVDVIVVGAGGAGMAAAAQAT